MANERIIVKSRQERGRWRAGRHFNRQGEIIAVSDLKKGELDALKDDPELIVLDAKEDLTPDELAIARQKAATKSAAGKKSWGEAETKARAAAGLDDAAWAALAPAERVAQVEAHLVTGD
ncbi:MAG: hypothetical protein ACREPD_16255 [Stenotrophomonas sp.]|uniref:hypothetical protein n=1 Tax=Stenotrophomonas sp. TaxID=69392 RepID=UPI003D6D50C1